MRLDYTFEALSKTLLLKDLLLAPSFVLASLPFDCHCSVLGNAIKVGSCPSLLRCPIHLSHYAFYSSYQVFLTAELNVVPAGGQSSMYRACVTISACLADTTSTGIIVIIAVFNIQYLGF